MSKIYYDDGSIAVTETEIRAKGYTLYLDNVYGVSVASLSLGKYILIPLALSLIPFGLVLFMFGRLALPALIFFIPMLLLAGLAVFFKNSRIMLQTSGGPVLAGQKLGFGDHTEGLNRFNKMKQAIEDAKAKRPPSSVPSPQPQKFTI